MVLGEVRSLESEITHLFSLEAGHDDFYQLWLSPSLATISAMVITLHLPLDRSLDLAGASPGSAPPQETMKYVSVTISSAEEIVSTK